MPRIGVAGGDAGTDVEAVSGDGDTVSVWQAASIRQDATANGAMAYLGMVSCAVE
nr:hypothetical protein [Burkholderia anthina]